MFILVRQASRVLPNRMGTASRGLHGWLHPKQHWRIFSAASNPKQLKAYQAAMQRQFPSLLNKAEQPLELLWCHHGKTNSILGEFALSIHQNHQVSAVGIPRLGTHSAFQELLSAFNVKHEVLKHPLDIDQRFKIAITNPLDDLADIFFLLNAINSVAPLDRLSQSIVNHLVLSAIKQRQGDSSSYEPHPLLETMPELHYNLLANHHHTNPPQKIYLPDLHREFPSGRTPLTRAIIQEDIETVQYCLQTDPLSVFKADAYNRSPLELVLGLDNTDIYEAVCHHAANTEIGCPALRAQAALYHAFLPEKRTLTNKTTGYSFKSALIEEERSTPPTRSNLHTHCAYGNNDAILQEMLDIKAIADDICQTHKNNQDPESFVNEHLPTLLKENAKKLLSPDPWGVTPLLMAIGEYQPETVESSLRLISQSHNPTQLNNQSEYSYTRASDYEGVCDVVRKYMHDPHALSAGIHEAIYRQDKKAIEDLRKLSVTYDLEDVGIEKQHHSLLEPHKMINGIDIAFDSYRDDTGLSPIEKCISLANASKDTEFLEHVLQHISFSIVEMSETDGIEANVLAVVQAHNERIQKCQDKKQQFPQYLSSEFDENSHTFCTQLTRDDQIIKAQVKPTHALSDAEQTDVAFIYHQNFTKIQVDASKNKAILPPSVFEDQLIELFKIDGKVVAFLLFQISYHETALQHPCFLFFAKLGANLSAFSNLGLVGFSFRLPILLKEVFADVAVESCYKAIYPGFAWYFLPQDCHAYPRYQRDEHTLTTLFALAGESIKIEDNPFKANYLKATHHTTRAELPNTPTSREYSELTDHNPEKAAPVSYEVTPYNTAGFFAERFKPHAFTEPEAKQSAAAFKQFLMEQGISPKPNNRR